MVYRSQPIWKRSLPGIVSLLMFFTVPTPLLAANAQATTIGEVSVTIHGERTKLDDPTRMMDGRLFFPVATLAKLFGATVAWDQDNQAMTIHTAEDTIIMSDGVPVVYVNDTRYVMDVAPFLAEGRTYIPVRYAAAFLGAAVQWDSEGRHAELLPLDPSAEQIASFITEAEPFTEEDLLLLAKIVQVEAGYESYEGQLAVANVILNRVKDSRFPNTIRDVIYSGRQFPPAHDGLLDKSKPNASVLRAAKDALNGKNNVDQAVYFYNPDVSRGAFWNSLDVVVEHGNHRFAE